MLLEISWGPPRHVHLLPWSCGGPSILLKVEAGPCANDPGPPHPPDKCLCRCYGVVFLFFLCVLGPHPPNCRWMSSAAVSLVLWMVMLLLLLVVLAWLVVIPTAAEGGRVPFFLVLKPTWEVEAWVYEVVWLVVVGWFEVVSVMKGWNEGVLVAETIFAPGPASF